MTVAQPAATHDRSVLRDADAERAVLGSILVNDHTFYRVIGTIDTDSFSKHAHRTIFAAMHRLAEQRWEIEPLLLIEELTRQHQLAEAGGSAYISSLLDSVPDLANIECCVQIMRKRS
jgi:replicative DNA helicase